MNQISKSTYGWVLDDRAVESLLRELGFREEIIRFIGQCSREISASREAFSFLEFCSCWQARARQKSGEEHPAHWNALAVVSAFPEALEKHRARRVPASISRATFFDLQRRMEEYYDREGEWGFDRLSWMSNHVGGHFFEIGRLQYAIGTFGYLYRVYRDSETGTVVPMALAGRRCTLDGWPVDGATGFETHLDERESGIYGHPASGENGSILPEVQRIAPDSEVLLNAESAVAHIHIPSGEKLEREACCASLKTAKAFIEQHFPELELRAFCTATWLLDPELRKVLPPHSNIVSFGRLFRPLALRNANDDQLLERVFGSDASWESCQAVNSLQKAVLRHHQNGGQFRSTAGFILAAEVDAL
jgi:hypothetical protein